MRRSFQRLEEWRVRAGVRAQTALTTVTVVLAVAAAVSIVWRYALVVGPAGQAAIARVEAFVLGGFALHRLLLIAFAPRPAVRAREERVGSVLAAALIAGFLAFRVSGLDVASGIVQRLERAGVVLVLAYVLGTTAYRVGLAGARRLRLAPTTLVIFSFAILISIGTGLLLSPRATPPGQDIGVVDALFTATSAGCVTGLTVRDTPTGFTRFGHWTILGLIQVGGLGIMTLAGFFASAVGRGLSIRDQVLMREALNVRDFGRLRQIVTYIFVSTIAIEILGAGLLYLFDDTPAASEAERAFFCVFHAISAYCNAGFSMYSANMVGLSSNAPVLLTVAGLVVVGGLGFVVTYNLFNVGLRGVPQRLFPGVWNVGRRPHGKVRLALQSRLVLLVTGVLIVGGTLLMAIYEWDEPALAGLSARDKVVACLFHSIMTRTAGFNAVDVGALGVGTLFVFMNLMFIGGSPGGTAGGIKTTTVAVLASRVVGLMRNREEIEMFERTIPRRIIAEANVVMFTSFVTLSVATLVLAYTDPQFTLLQTLFECVSAFGTVGLSTGITPHLSDAGKLLITVLMFAGRLGPLTLVLSMGQRSASRPIFQYPTGRVMIG